MRKKNKLPESCPDCGKLCKNHLGLIMHMSKAHKSHPDDARAMPSVEDDPYGEPGAVKPAADIRIDYCPGCGLSFEPMKAIYTPLNFCPRCSFCIQALAKALEKGLS